MFLKQHSLFDVLTGIGLASAMYVLVYRHDLLANMRGALRVVGVPEREGQETVWLHAPGDYGRCHESAWQRRSQTGR